jgi:hypothetical protein
MTYIFNIDQSFIKAVDDVTARELVARLCRAELRAQGLPESAVTWGGDQRAKDGGVDVRVDCPCPLRAPDFVRTACMAFQVKAEKFPPAKIHEEMAPKGTLRPAIMELKETGGTYIIASTQDDNADLALQPRRDAIRQCLTDYGLETSVQSDFYDSRRIADWVEQHPPIATWLRYKIGKPLRGWRPYGPWAHRADDPEAEYLVDDRVRVFVPGVEGGSDIIHVIAQLRQELANTVSVRIVGLSGVGKTRLVQALFDPRVCPETLALKSENVIYVDLADEPEPQPQGMLESLLALGSDSIVVVDNCGPDTHERLTAIVKRSGSRLKLITIEYDIRDDLPEDTLCYRLEGASETVITKLLRDRYKDISESDADRIAEFSDGNARVAFALASTVETGGELSRLRNRELFERLFRQKNEPNDELLKCAEVASLLYSFDGFDVSIDSELARFASLAEVTPLTFLRHMAELKRRGLLQERGQWRAVLPHAIANGLARRIIESAPKQLLYGLFIERGGERIARSFTRRLGFLHDCPEVVAIASQMLSSDGKLGDLTKLSDFEQQMFVNLAPVDPRGALDSINRAIEKDDFLSIDTRSRTQFIRVARSIAYEPEYFNDSVLILLRFALVEPEDYKREPARDILKSLFYCQLSGTQAVPAQRRKVVEDLITSCDEVKCRLGFYLLEAGLETWNFSSHYGFEFGARHRDYGWYPRSQAEVRDWFRPWIEIAASVGEQDTARGRKARTILGEALRGLWGRVGLDDELVDVARRLRVIDGWTEGWLGVRRIFNWDAKALTPTSLAQLKEIEKTLAPSDLVSEIRARVLARGTFAYDLEDEELLENGGSTSTPLSATEKIQRAYMKAEELGAAAAQSPELLETLIADLCSKDLGSGVYSFGLGVGKHHEDMAGLLEAVRIHIEHANGNNLSLIWVRGLLSGWKDVDPDAVEAFLDDAVENIVWRNWFVELQVQVNLDAQAFDRLLRVLTSDYCPTWQFNYLAMGRATDPWTVSQLITLACKLALKTDRGLSTAIHLLSMVIYCADKKDDQYRCELGEALLEFLSKIDWSMVSVGHTQMDDHHLGVVVEFALKAAKSESKVASILTRMAQTDESDQIRYDDVRKNALKPFFRYFPRLALELVCIQDKDGSYERATDLVCEQYSVRHETAFQVIQQEVLIDWCNKNPEARYPFAAGACKLFDVQDDGKAPSAISDIAKALLAASPDKAAVISQFVRRFHPMSWSGSLADIMQARLPLLDHLLIAGDEAIASEIAAAKTKLQKSIDAERARENKEEKSRYSSFE